MISPVPDADSQLMKQRQLAERVLGWLLYAAAAGFILAYLYIASQRIGYPYELEWMEGASVDHVARLLDGEKLYVEPTPDFVPFIYTPGYFYAAAGLARVFGVEMMPLRLLSFLASLGSLALIGRFAQRETGRRASGLVAAGLFAASFPLSGSWFDLARIDSLFLLLLLAGCDRVRASRSLAGAVAAGLLLALAFQTKQSALVVAVPVLLTAAVLRGRQGLVAGLAFAAGVALSVGALVASHPHWFWYYTMQLPRQHPVAAASLSEFWTVDVAAIPVAFGLGAAYLIHRVARERGAAIDHLVFAGAMLACAWLSRLHGGGFVNVLMPLHAAIAIAAGCSWGSAAVGSGPRWLRPAIGAALVGQFVLLVYDPSSAVPSARHRTAFDALVERIREIDGPVIVPYHGHLTALAGKERHAHTMAVADVLRGTDRALRSRLYLAIDERIERREFGAIVLDDPSWHRAKLERHYRYAGPSVPDSEAMRSLSGAPQRPWLLYLPRSE